MQDVFSLISCIPARAERNAEDHIANTHIQINLEVIYVFYWFQLTKCIGNVSRIVRCLDRNFSVTNVDNPIY